MDLERRARLRQRLQRDVQRAPVVASWNTAWRWLKVPRSTSSPVSRMRMPSARIDASASSSAAAQSTVRSSGSSSTVRALLAAALELAVDREARRAAPAATSLSSRSRSSGTAVCDLSRRRPAAAAPGYGSTKSCSGCSVVERLLRAPSMCFLHDRVGASPAATTPRSTSVCAQISRTVGCDGDLLVHQRLRERRLVAFVVAVAAVADRSIRKSRWNVARYAHASRAASRHASGSSALTWTIGILKPRARPLA